MRDMEGVTPSSSLTDKRYVNILLFDIEDWFQSKYFLNHPITERVEKNTRTLLDILRQIKVQATSFVQGMVAEKFPHLLLEIDQDGHELAMHGYLHQPVNYMGKELFRDDLRRSID